MDTFGGEGEHALAPARVSVGNNLIMRALRLGNSGEALSVLCLGAHSDDIEIGVDATLLSLIAGGFGSKFYGARLAAVANASRERGPQRPILLPRLHARRSTYCSFVTDFFPARARPNAGSQQLTTNRPFLLLAQLMALLRRQASLTRYSLVNQWQETSQVGS
jgi:hypothetical protein